MGGFGIAQRGIIFFTCVKVQRVLILHQSNISLCFRASEGAVFLGFADNIQSLLPALLMNI